MPKLSDIIFLLVFLGTMAGWEFDAASVFFCYILCAKVEMINSYLQFKASSNTANSFLQIQ